MSVVLSLWLYWSAPVTHNITICNPMLYSKVCDIYLLELIFYLRAFLQWITHSLDSLYCPLKASNGLVLHSLKNIHVRSQKVSTYSILTMYVVNWRSAWFQRTLIILCYPNGGPWKCSENVVPQSRIFFGRKRNLTQESSEKILSSMWESNPWHYNLSLITSELLQTPRWTGLKFNQNKTSHRELFWYNTTKINKKLLYKTCWSINCPCIG